MGPFGIAVQDEALAVAVKDGLHRVEELLLASTSSQYPYISEITSHLAQAGGKRFRPLLVLLAAQFGDHEAPGIVESAVVVELTHLATLYHDDVMDEAALRRGVTSANQRWDNSLAILSGDFLFARASTLLADLGPDAVRIQAETFERLVSGQISESVGPASGQHPVTHHLDVLAGKTGSLIATSARFGAMFAGCAPQDVQLVAEFGELFGVAFQLSDDLLDIESESEQSGKTPGTDLREGVHTLPMLIALAKDPSGDPATARLQELLRTDLAADDAAFEEALGLLRAHSSMEEARDVVRGYAQKAKSVLEPLPDVPAKEALRSLCDVVISRMV
ncbi:MAG: polyprenyl synthetase family protein [Catenulispora sp.]|nr:polyprenyl synthetase family protein [Catenulispora sp.]